MQSAIPSLHTTKSPSWTNSANICWKIPCGILTKQQQTHTHTHTHFDIHIYHLISSDGHLIKIFFLNFPLFQIGTLPKGILDLQTDPELPETNHQPLSCLHWLRLVPAAPSSNDEESPRTVARNFIAKVFLNLGSLCEPFWRKLEIFGINARATAMSERTEMVVGNSWTLQQLRSGQQICKTLHIYSANVVKSATPGLHTTKSPSWTNSANICWKIPCGILTKRQQTHTSTRKFIIWYHLMVIWSKYFFLYNFPLFQFSTLLKYPNGSWVAWNQPPDPELLTRCSKLQWRRITWHGHTEFHCQSFLESWVTLGINKLPKMSRF